MWVCANRYILSAEGGLIFVCPLTQARTALTPQDSEKKRWEGRGEPSRHEQGCDEKSLVLQCLGSRGGSSDFQLAARGLVTTAGST